MVSYSSEEVKVLLRSVFSKSSPGRIQQFEQQFAKYVDLPHAVAVSSIREGLSRLIDLMEFKPGDEIILCAYNYHVIPLLLQKKDLVPVFVDIEPGSMNIDAAQIESKITERTKCVIATHLFGESAQIDQITDICHEHNLILIEDAAHSCGAEWNDKKIGSYGDYGLFSFGTGKPLVTLGGGMIVGKNDKILNHLRDEVSDRSESNNRSKSAGYFLKCLIQIALTNRILFAVGIYPLLALLGLFGWDAIERLTGDKYTPADITSKSNLGGFTTLQAGLGMAQLRKLDQFNDGRIAHALVLDKMLKDIKELRRTQVDSTRKNVILSYNLVMDGVAKFRRTLLLRGIDTRESSMRNCAKLIYDAAESEYPQVSIIDDRIVELPCSHLLNIKDIYYIGNTVRKYFGYQPIQPEPKIVRDE